MLFYNIHDLLLIESEVPGYIPDYFILDNKKNDDLNPDLVIRRLISPSSYNLTENATSTFYSSTDNFITYNKSLFGNKISWSIKNLNSRTTEVSISKGYELLSHLVRLPVAGILPVSCFIRSIIQLKLLQKSYMFTIAGCIKPINNINGVLLPAASGIGKTTLVTELVRKESAKFISEDTVIIDPLEDVVYSYPQMMKKRVSHIISTENYMSVTDVFNILDSIRVDTIIFIERGIKDSLDAISPEIASTKLVSINRKNLPYFYENTILNYSNVDHSFRIHDIMSNEWNICSKFVKNKKCYVLKYGPNRLAYIAELIKEVL